MDEIASKSAIAQHLRRRIVSGEFSPGSRLPTRAELERQFETTKVTVQRAFEVLQGEGFVNTEERRGTFVAQDLPHQTRYALAFPSHPSARSGPWTRFSSALVNDAAHIEEACHRKIPVFYDVNYENTALNKHDAQRLLYQMRTHQLAGVIFTFPLPVFFQPPGTGAMDIRENIPAGTRMVVIMDGVSDIGVPSVKIDYDSFFEQALSLLTSQRCRRVAAINPMNIYESHREAFFRSATARGLKTQPSWWLPASLDVVQTARPYTHLLMNGSGADRPDALIISDDNLVEPVAAGLMDAGIRVPQDLRIVAHSNFPAPPPPLPMRRLGYPAHQVLETCLDLLDRQRRGEAVPSMTSIKAVFESKAL